MNMQDDIIIKQQQIKNILNDNLQPVFAFKKIAAILDTFKYQKSQSVNMETEITGNVESITAIKNLVAPFRMQLIKCYLECAAVTTVRDLKKLGKITAPKRMAAILGSAAAEFGYLLARHCDSYGPIPLHFRDESNQIANNEQTYSQKINKKRSGSVFKSINKRKDKSKYFERICAEAYAIISRAINTTSPKINVYEALAKSINADSQSNSENIVFRFLEHFSGLGKGNTSNHFRHTLEALSHGKLLDAQEIFREHLEMLYKIQHPVMNHIMFAMQLLLTNSMPEDQVTQNLISDDEIKHLKMFISKHAKETCTILSENENAKKLVEIINTAKLAPNNDNKDKALEAIAVIIKNLPRNHFLGINTMFQAETASRGQKKIASSKEENQQKKPLLPPIKPNLQEILLRNSNQEEQQHKPVLPSIKPNLSQMILDEIRKDYVNNLANLHSLADQLTQGDTLTESQLQGLEVKKAQFERAKKIEGLPADQNQKISKLIDICEEVLATNLKVGENHSISLQP